MGLETIEKEIVEMANKQASIKINEATAKSFEIRKETEEMIVSEDRQAEEETEKMIEQIKQAFDAMAKFEIKKTELSAKKEIIERVFAQTIEKIESLDDKKLEKLTKKLLEEAEEEIDIDVVYCNEKAKKWIPKEYKVKTENMLGGVMAETKDGKIRVDNRFETILEEVRRDALKKIAKAVI